MMSKLSKLIWNRDQINKENIISFGREKAIILQRYRLRLSRLLPFHALLMFALVILSQYPIALWSYQYCKRLNKRNHKKTDNPTPT